MTSQPSDRYAVLTTERVQMSEWMRRTIHGMNDLYFFVLLIAIISLGLSDAAWAAQDASAHPSWPGPGQLFVGACCQPIDRTPEQVDQDIAIMKRAGFNVVRMGDLSWHCGNT